MGEDEGFNAVVPYTEAGEELIRRTVEAGDLVVGDPLTARDLDDMQPHQVRKKVALADRYAALAAADRPVISAVQLRVERNASTVSAEERAAQVEGTARRIAAGRYDESVD